jgi:UDP-hydrolysing UDP-N-acetyl-D-glucosamine 2-epimerase
MKKLCVVTGTRAEYGLLKHLMRAIADSSDFQLQLVVAAAHLLPQLGSTQTEILADGFLPDAQVDMLLASNTPLGVAKSTALGMLGFSDTFDRLKPDMVFILGDRFEALAAAQAAYLQRIPVAHLHGGELTLGALDDAIRHAITKLSALHFVAHEDYARRVRQLGEEDWRVQLVGPMVADALVNLTWLSRDVLAHDLGLDVQKQWVLLTFHPETLGSEDDIAAVNAIYEALCQQLPDAEYIWTYPNMDAGGDRILNWLLATAKADTRIKVVDSLGQQRYLSVMKESIAVVGNSSSGLLEAPWLGIPTVNVGTRQAGRLRSETVFDCSPDAVEIGLALVQTELIKVAMPQQINVAPSKKILSYLSHLNWQVLLPKGFTDREGV